MSNTDTTPKINWGWGNHIGCVRFNVFVLSGRSWIKTEDYQIGVCCFFTRHETLRSKNKDWKADNHQDNVVSDMSIY